jgi:hypothetical protein
MRRTSLRFAQRLAVASLQVEEGNVERPFPPPAVRERRQAEYQGTGTGGNDQMSRAYSRMVRSLENLPTRAVFKIAIFAQRS